MTKTPITHDFIDLLAEAPSEAIEKLLIAFIGAGENSPETYEDVAQIRRWLDQYTAPETPIDAIRRLLERFEQRRAQVLRADYGGWQHERYFFQDKDVNQLCSAIRNWLAECDAAEQASETA